MNSAERKRRKNNLRVKLMIIVAVTNTKGVVSQRNSPHTPATVNESASTLEVSFQLIVWRNLTWDFRIFYAPYACIVFIDDICWTLWRLPHPFFKIYIF